MATNTDRVTHKLLTAADIFDSDVDIDVEPANRFLWVHVKPSSCFHSAARNWISHPKSNGCKVPSSLQSSRAASLSIGMPGRCGSGLMAVCRLQRMGCLARRSVEAKRRLFDWLFFMLMDDSTRIQ